MCLSMLLPVVQEVTGCIALMTEERSRQNGCWASCHWLTCSSPGQPPENWKDKKLKNGKRTAGQLQKVARQGEPAGTMGKR